MDLVFFSLPLDVSPISNVVVSGHILGLLQPDNPAPINIKHNNIINHLLLNI
tara:strand:+ start:1364 stop:1519 length:156 start_codon:yes stop_codon:yes gene_type:complete